MSIIPVPYRPTPSWYNPKRDTFIRYIAPGVILVANTAKRVAQSTLKSYFKTKKPRAIPQNPNGAPIDLIPVGPGTGTQAPQDIIVPYPTTESEGEDYGEPNQKRMPMKHYYTGRFKRPRTKPNVYNGVTWKREQAWTVTDDDGTAEPGSHPSPIGAVWTGVSALTVEDFQVTVLLSILRKLCAAKGLEFNSGDELVSETITATGANIASFSYSYINANDGEEFIHSFDVADAQRWIDVANSWQANIDTNFTTFADYRFNKIWMLTKIDTLGNENSALPILSLSLIDMKISFNCTHAINIQNRTRDSGGSDSTNVIDSNPLKGRLYVIQGSRVNINLQNIGVGGSGVIAGHPNRASGRYRWDPQIWTDPDYQQLFARLVPQAAFDNCYESANVYLQPGEIKRASVSFKREMKFDKLFLKTFLPNAVYGSPTNSYPYQFGRSIMIGFEKVVRTATVDSAEAYASRIQIGVTGKSAMQCEAHPKRKQAFIARNLCPEVN